MSPILHLTPLYQFAIADSTAFEQAAAEGSVGVAALISTIIFLLMFIAISFRPLHETAAALLGAVALSEIYTAVGVDLGAEDLLTSWEIDADDVATAREAALALSQIYTAVGVDLGEEDLLRGWEIDADDIAAAREAAHYLAAVVQVSREQHVGGW